MKLRKLSVNQFKRFTEPTQLVELRDGLNLVVGPNELGKSTMVDALQAVLFQRYSSRARPIVELQNDRSRAAPVVELVFEIDGAEYTLTKRFVKNFYAQLECPDGARLEADAAEAELRRLLGFAEAARGGASPETLGMWGVLWVQQGQSFRKPSLPDLALASLSASLESEVGMVLGGRRGRELPQVIEKRRDELISAERHHPRGEYKTAVEQATALQYRLDGQQQQQRDISGALEQLEDNETRLKQLEEGNQDQSDQEALNQARNQLNAVKQHELKLKAEHSELRNWQRHLDQAKRAQSERASLRADLADQQKQLRQAHENLDGLQQREREALVPLEQLRQAMNDAEAAVEEAEQSEEQARDTLDVISRSAELNELVRRREDVADAQQRLNDARRQADQIKVTDVLLRRIRQAEDAANQATAQLKTTAPRISFDIPRDRLTGIEIAGAPLTDPPTTIEALEQVAIVIPERGRILVDPAIPDRDKLLRARRTAQTRLRTALKQAGAQSLVDAENLRDQRRTFEATAKAAEQELKRRTPSDGALKLQNRIEELRLWQASLSSEWQTTALPERDQAEAALRNTQKDLRNAKNEERATRAAFEERRQAVEQHSTEVLKVRTAMDSQTGVIQRLEEKLRNDVETTSDEQLDVAVRAAERAVEEQQRTVSELEEDESTSERPRLEARIRRLESAIEQRAELRTSLKTENARLSERIEINDGAGIDEAIEHTQRELEQATQERNHLEREIAVLDLLRDTLRAAEIEAKERYLAPVINRVRPYLQMLFPNAEIKMDEDLNITGMSRREGYEEPFEHLSMGTQEQIAVLVRLAFAEMLIDQGTPAAVVLDDALAFSDDYRMQLMFDILSHAAQRVQIVVFTCREQIFEGLGAYQLQITPADPESLRSA